MKELLTLIYVQSYIYACSILEGMWFFDSNWRELSCKSLPSSRLALIDCKTSLLHSILGIPLFFSFWWYPLVHSLWPSVLIHSIVNIHSTAVVWSLYFLLLFCRLSCFLLSADFYFVASVRSHCYLPNNPFLTLLVFICTSGWLHVLLIHKYIYFQKYSKI